MTRDTCHQSSKIAVPSRLCRGYAVIRGCDLGAWLLTDRMGHERGADLEGPCRRLPKVPAGGSQLGAAPLRVCRITAPRENVPVEGSAAMRRGGKACEFKTLVY